jgi:FMN phosphatase YigB (HAD superfamily)
MISIKHIVTDNDGTAIGFDPWFAKGILEALPQIAPVLGVSIDELGERIGENMVAARTHEDAFVFRGPYFAALWGNRSHEEFVRLVTIPFYTKLDNARDALPLFEGASQTIKTFAAESVGVHVLSDAALYATIAKLKRLAAKGVISSIYAIETVPPDPGEIWNQADFTYCWERVQKSLALAETFPNTKVVGLPRHWQKPNPIGLRTLMADMGIRAGEAFYIGDSTKKDGAVAHDVGMMYFRFGATSASPEEADVINVLLNPDKASGPFSWHRSEEPEPPVHRIVHHWDEILPMISRGDFDANIPVGAC